MKQLAETDVFLYTFCLFVLLLKLYYHLIVREQLFPYLMLHSKTQSNLFKAREILRTTHTFVFCVLFPGHMSHERNAFWHSTINWMSRVSLNAPLRSFQKDPCSRLHYHASVQDLKHKKRFTWLDHYLRHILSLCKLILILFLNECKQTAICGGNQSESYAWENSWQ